MLSKGLSKNIFSVISTRLLLKGINFLSLYILLRYLDPKELGEYGLFISTLVLSTTLGNLGLRNSSARSIGSEGNFALNITCISIAFPLLMMVSIGIMLGFLYSSGFNLDNPINVISIIIGVVCHLLIILRQGICLGTGDIKLFNILEIIPRVTLLVIVLIAVRAFDGFYDNFAIHALVAGYILAAFLIFWVTDLKMVKKFKNHLRHLVKSGFVYALALSLIILNTYIPIFLTSLMYGASDAGQIFAALRINDIFLELATATGLVLFSHAARSNKPSDTKKIIKTFGFIIITSIASCVFIRLYATELIILISGEKYIAAASNLAIISLALPFVAFNKMSYGIISGKGHPLVGVCIYIIVITTNISLIWYLNTNSFDNFILYSLIISQAFASLMFLLVVYVFIRRKIL